MEVASSSVSFNPKSSPHPKRIRVILALTELEVIPWINQREIRDELMLANVKSVPQDESRHSAHFQPFHLRNMPFVSSEYVLGMVQNYTFTIKVECTITHTLSCQCTQKVPHRQQCRFMARVKQDRRCKMQIMSKQLETGRHCQIPVCVILCRHPASRPPNSTLQNTRTS